MHACTAGAPIGAALKQLLTALTDLKSWTDRYTLTKEVMRGMLGVRSNVHELSAKYKLK